MVAQLVGQPADQKVMCVRFPMRAHAGAVGLVPRQAMCRRQLVGVSLLH